MSCGRIVRVIVPEYAQRRPHARGARRIELRRDIGDEEHVGRPASECCGDLAITARFFFWPRRRVEVAREQWREITRGGVREEIALRLDTAGRKDGDLLAGCSPPLERRSDVRVDLAFPLELSALVPCLPNATLE